MNNSKKAGKDIRDSSTSSESLDTVKNKIDSFALPIEEAILLYFKDCIIHKE